MQLKIRGERQKKKNMSVLKKIYIILLLPWMHECSSDSKLSNNMKRMKAVKDKVLNGYDKTIRPTTINSNTTNILTLFVPRQILDVDEEKGLFELSSYLILHWTDTRLTWDTAKYSGLLRLQTDLFWVPDISIFNSHSAPVDPTQNVVLLYVLNGSVTWIPPTHTSTSCPSLLQAIYPGDVVTCGIKMGSWGHTGQEVDLDHSGFVWTDDFVNIHPRWELLQSEVKVERNTIYYQGYNDTFHFNEILFPLRRRPSPEVEVTKSPCILVMLLTLAMFWMPPDSTNKLMVGGISILSLIVLLIYVACSTKFPLRVLLAVWFLQSTMYIVVVSFLLQLLFIFNLCNITGPTRPPAAIMNLLSGPFGKYTCLRSTPSNNNSFTNRLYLKEDSQNLIKQQTPKDDWLLFASGLDRLFFVLISISLIAIYHV